MDQGRRVNNTWRRRVRVATVYAWSRNLEVGRISTIKLESQWVISWNCPTKRHQEIIDYKQPHVMKYDKCMYVYRFLKYQRFGGEKNRSLLVFIFSKTQLTQIGLRFLEREKKRQKGKWGWNKSDSRNSTDCRLSSSCWERQLPMSSCSSCGPTVVDSCCQWGRLRPRPRGCYSRWGRPPAGPRYLCREVVDLQMLEHFYNESLLKSFLYSRQK